MARGLALLLLLLAGCGASDDAPGPSASAGTAGASGSDGLGGASGSGGSSGGGWPGGAAGSAGQTDPFTLAFVKPDEGQVHLQSGLPPKAVVEFEVGAGPGIAEIEYVIENDFSLGRSSSGPNFPLSYDYAYVGQRWARALGFASDARLVAESLVSFVVEAPAPTTCLGELDRLGVAYTNTGARGVVDAVKLAGPLNGILFARNNTDDPSTDPMACEFVLTLYRFADLLKSRGYVKIGGLGSYCYRCCCSWSTENYCRGPNDPEPDCSANGYSNHSWGRALDVRWLYKATGEIYDINDPSHWVRWPTASESCTKGLAAQTGISQELYSLACEATGLKIFGLILTPNYNSAHRNHWHADIGQSGTPTSYKVLSSQPGAVDVTEHPDE
jgi:hypothetical protein